MLLVPAEPVCRFAGDLTLVLVQDRGDGEPGEPVDVGAVLSDAEPVEEVRVLTNSIGPSAFSRLPIWPSTYFSSIAAIYSLISSSECPVSLPNHYDLESL